jgi:hypothetical protein
VPSRPLTARLAGMPLRWFGVGAGVLGLAVSGLFGGLRPIHTVPTTPQVKVGEVDKGTPWNVTVVGCQLQPATYLDPTEPDKDGDHWFVVAARIEVTSDDSMSGISDVIRVAKVPGLQSEDPAWIFLARDHSVANYLNPGMPELVDFVWEQSGSVTPPATALVQIYGETLGISSLTGNEEWQDRAVRTEVTAPVEKIRS